MPGTASYGVSLPPFVYLLLAVLAVRYRSEMHTTLYIWWEESSASVECILYCIHILFYLRAQLCCKSLQNVKPSVQQKHRQEKLAYNLLGCDTSQKKPELKLTTPGTVMKSRAAQVKEGVSAPALCHGLSRPWVPSMCCSRTTAPSTEPRPTVCKSPPVPPMAWRQPELGRDVGRPRAQAQSQ